MTPEEFSHQHPHLYHMAHAAALPSIRRHGLLSTERIVALLDLPQPDRDRLCAHHRPEIVPLAHPELGDFRLRDQKPLNPKALARSLPPDLTVHDWYRTLNARTFLWIHRSSLDKLLAARAYRSTPHLILTIDSSALLARHLDRITVTTSNTGAAFPLGTAPAASPASSLSTPTPPMGPARSSSSSPSSAASPTSATTSSTPKSPRLSLREQENSSAELDPAAPPPPSPRLQQSRPR